MCERGHALRGLFGEQPTMGRLQERRLGMPRSAALRHPGPALDIRLPCKLLERWWAIPTMGCW